MKKPILLDLFCKAGGCSVGYALAGFEVIGCDIEPQPNYPFKFFLGDWKEALEKYGNRVDAFHASPPCQDYSRTKSLHSNQYPDLLEPVRLALQKTGKPYVIENVMGSPMKNPITLNGQMFGLKVVRKRMFESNKLILMPGKGRKVGSVGGKNCTRETFNGIFIVGGNQMGTLAEWKNAMGIDWMKTKHELAEAIPPPIRI